MRVLALLFGVLLSWPGWAQQVSDPLPRHSKGAVTMTDAKAAAQTADSGTLSAFTQPGVTAMSIANAVCGGVAGCGYTNNDALRGVNVAPAGSTVVNTTAVAGYLRNQTVSGTPPDYGRNAVLLFGSGTCEVDGCKTWGVNTVLVDAAGKGMTSGTNRVIVGAEYDFIISNAANQAIGVMVTGDALVQPTLANAFAVLPLGQQAGPSPVRWTGGFVTGSGAAAEAFVAGAAARSGNDVPSQRSIFGYYDNTGAPGAVGIGAGTVAGNNTPQFSFTSTAPAVDLALSGMLKLVGYPPGGISIGGFQVLKGGYSGVGDQTTLYLGNDSGILNNVLGGTNAVLHLNGTIVQITPSSGAFKAIGLPAIGAGTGKRWLCIDATTKDIYEGSGGGCN